VVIKELFDVTGIEARSFNFEYYLAVIVKCTYWWDKNKEIIKTASAKNKKLLKTVRGVTES